MASHLTKFNLGQHFSLTYVNAHCPEIFMVSQQRGRTHA